VLLRCRRGDLCVIVWGDTRRRTFEDEANRTAAPDLAAGAAVSSLGVESLGLRVEVDPIRWARNKVEYGVGLAARRTPTGPARPLQRFNFLMC
jgi:hypothetical protein